MKSQNYNKIIKTLKTKGFKKIELDPILESKFILQRSGENFRKYLFSFYNSDAQELTLIPDLSISSILRYVQSKKKSKEKVFYTGSAFRKSYNKNKVVIRQLGLEIFSSQNENKDDKEIIDTSITILKNAGIKSAKIKIGNFKLFELLIQKLSIPERWKKRLIKFQNEAEIIKLRYKQSLIDKTVKILFENKVKNENKYFGRDEYFNSVIVESDDDIIGKIKNVKILKGNQTTLFGEIISNLNQTNFAA